MLLADARFSFSFYRFADAMADKFVVNHLWTVVVDVGRANHI